MPNKNYYLYPKAIEDLEKIYLYGRSEFGVKKSETYIKALETGFQKMTSNPEMARNCDYIRSKLKAWPIGSHVIYFKPTKSGIVVIRILHKSMDCLRHLS